MALQCGGIYKVRNGMRIDPMLYLGERIIEQRRDKYGMLLQNRRVRHLFRNQRTGRMVELKSLNRVQQIGVN